MLTLIGVNMTAPPHLSELSLDDGWDGRIRTYGTLYQKQLPYHLATSQQWRDVYDGRAL